MHGSECEQIVRECLPHTTKLKYYFNPIETIRMFMFADGLVIIIRKNLLSTDYIVGTTTENSQKLSIFHDIRHDNEKTKSDLKERIKTFLILSILRRP